MGVTPQAFTLFNGDAATDRAIAFALRLEREQPRLETQIRRAIRLAFGRAAADQEVESLSDYATRMRAYHAQTPADPVVYPTQITRSLVEELSGKSFEYTEILPVFEDYKPDVKPSMVGPQTRALADVCLLLLNANEFVYVY